MKLFQFTIIRFVSIGSTTISVAAILAGCGHITGTSQAAYSHIKEAVQPAPVDSSPPAPVIRLSDEQVGTSYQQQGIIAKHDYRRLVKIQNGINRTQMLSDADVDFLLHQLSSGPMRSTSTNKVSFENIVLSHTYGIKPKRLTASQMSRLYNAILPFINSSHQAVKVNASLALASTRDPRAIRVLEHMSQTDPSPVVRLNANEWLKRLREVHVTLGK